MKKFNKTKIYNQFGKSSDQNSPEFQEILSVIPGSFLRWGTVLFLGIIIAILGIGWLVKSPDLIYAPITVTTFNPPISLVAKSEGEIDRFFVNNGEKVFEGQHVALIKNQARWEDIQVIEDYINILGDSITFSIIQDKGIPKGLILGELQNTWLKFNKSYQKYYAYICQSYIHLKLELLNKQAERIQEYIVETKKQKLLAEEDLKLTYSGYLRDSILFHMSNHSISLNEYEKSKQELIQKQISFATLVSSIKNDETSILKMKETCLDLNIQLQRETNQFATDLDEAYQFLKISFGDWKEKYLIQSPSNGKITFTTFWSRNQIIKYGEVLAAIIPDNSQKVIVKAKVPASSFGQINIGQQANIKLSGYPYLEYGILRGQITFISMVTSQDAYIVDIELNNGLRTSYGFELRYMDGMTGKAEIITNNVKLIYKLIKPIRRFKNNK